ncbi:hypothetical protein BH09PLA1_BH09PLA1_20810 [soil metagenome]
MNAAVTKPALQVASARDLGPQFVENPHRMVGQDGAFSIPLEGNDQNGEALWFFGDTLVGARPTGHSIWQIDGKVVGPWDMSGRGTFERMINNTALILPKQTGRHGLKDFRYLLDETGGLKTLLPLEGDEHPDQIRMWCQHGICIGERVYLSFIKVRMLAENTGPLPIAFEIIGSGLAVGRRREWKFTRLTGDSGEDDEDILWRADQPHFATAFLEHPSDGCVYLFGTVQRDSKQSCYVACACDDVGNPGAYKYLASLEPKWSANVADAISVFDGMPSELSVSFNRHLGKFLAVHSLDLSGKIVARTAPEPWGLWSEPVTLWTVQAKHKFPRPYPITLIYAGKEHPELSSDSGRTIYLTYIEFEEYYPHLIEVTLA